MQVREKIVYWWKEVETLTSNGLADLRGISTHRQRLAGSVATVLMLHGLFLWLLLVAHPTVMKLPEHDDESLPIELFEPIPPEPKPEPVPVERTETVPDVQPRQVQPPEPQPVPQPQPEVQPKPQPQPAPYTPLPKTTTAPRDTVDAVKTPTLRTLNDTRLQDSRTPNVVLDAEPNPALQARKQEADRVEAKKKQQALTAPSVNDLDLHDAPIPVLQAAPETGLTNDKTKQAAAGAGAGAPASGAPGSLNGTGLKGRGAASQALQNHIDCSAKQIDGKPIPPACNMRALNQMNGLGTGDPASRAYYGPIVAKQEADARYKAEPGNSDYWKRVNAAPTGRYEPDDQPRKGAYSNEKDQRVLGSCGQSDSCGNTKK